MDRAIVYAGALPQTTDVLNTNKFALQSMASLCQAILGTPGVSWVAGMACAPTTPASLQVTVGAGSIYAEDETDATGYGDLGVDISVILKQGILAAPVTLTLTPPITAGYSQTYLVQAILNDFDSGSTVLPYFNAANPAQTFSGPGNDGQPNYTIRKTTCAVALKAGAAASTGSQVAPSPDIGYVGLYTITLANGQTQITGGYIKSLATAPTFPTLPAIPADVQDSVWQYAADTSGTPNTMIAAITPAPAYPYPAGLLVFIKVANGNTGNTTLALNGNPSAPVHRANGAQLASGDLSVGQIVALLFDGTAFQTLNFEGFTSSTTNNNTYITNLPYVADSGSTNALVAAFSPAITSLVAGEAVLVKVANTVSGPATLAVNGLSPVAIHTQNGLPLTAGSIVSGQIILLIFDGTYFQTYVSATAAAAGNGGLAGQATDLTGSAPGGTATATWTASELVVETALGGTPYQLKNVSLSFNGATNGANGMDAGGIMAGDLHIYAIWNPTTNTLSCLGTATFYGRCYTGGSMPTGYVASGLIWSGKVDSSNHIYQFVQRDRKVDVASANGMYTNIVYAGASTPTQVSLAACCPANVKSAWGYLNWAGGATYLWIASTPPQTPGATPNTSNGGMVGCMVAGQSSSDNWAEVLINPATPCSLFWFNWYGDLSDIKLSGYSF